MEKIRYMISDAAKKVEVEAHVLRYWEEELELPISRTELGHRYYTEEDIHKFQKIKELKDRGFQLKAIKLLLPQMGAAATVEEKVCTFERIDTEEEKNKEYKLPVRFNEREEQILDRVMCRVEERMRLHEAKEEAWYRHLDEMIREHQNAKREVAVTRERRKRWW